MNPAAPISTAIAIALALAITVALVRAKGTHTMPANPDAEAAPRSTAHDDPSMPLQAMRSGVGYRTIKTMFGRDVPVVGTTDAFEASVAWSDAGEAMLWLRIEHATLRSGNPVRDAHVSKILGGGASPYIQIFSDWLSRSDIDRGAARGVLRVPATITIGSRRSPIELRVRFGTGSDAATLQIHATTAFTRLGIDVPRVGPFGLIATPRDPLELFATVDVHTVSGAAQALAVAGGPH